MPTIAFILPKGGAGKTTLCTVVAEQLAAAGSSVVVIDMDPIQVIYNFVRDREEIGLPSSFDVRPRPSTGNLLDATANTLDECVAAYDFVLIDTEGIGDRINITLSHQCDLIVIPITSDPVEVKQASALIRELKMNKVEAPYCLAFNRVPAAMQTINERKVRDELESAAIPLLDTRLHNRAIFPHMRRENALLADFEEQLKLPEQERLIEVTSDQKQIQAATANARDLTQSIINMLTKED